MATVFYRSGYK